MRHPTNPHHPCPNTPQVLRVVEDILYAPSQEEGERILGEAMAELEAQGAAAPAPAGSMAPGADGAAAADEGAAAAPGETQEESTAAGTPAVEAVGCAA